jgi:transcriptional regulator with XRE-family HTH domain
VAERSGLRAKSTKDAPEDAEAFTHAVGEAIRRVRTAKGWTQVDLAEASGLSSNYVARLERGEVGPSLFVAQRICDALDTDLDALTGTGAKSTGKTTKRRAAR